VAGADDQTFDGGCQALDDLVVSRADDNEASAGAAVLARVTEGRDEDAGDGLIEVGVFVDDDGVLAAHLRDDAFDLSLAGSDLRRRQDDAEANTFAAGKRDRLDAGMLHERLPYLTSGSRKILDGCCGNACFV